MLNERIDQNPSLAAARDTATQKAGAAANYISSFLPSWASSSNAAGAGHSDASEPGANDQSAATNQNSTSNNEEQKQKPTNDDGFAQM